MVRSFWKSGISKYLGAMGGHGEDEGHFRLSRARGCLQKGPTRPLRVRRSGRKGPCRAGYSTGAGGSGLGSEYTLTFYSVVAFNDE